MADSLLTDPTDSFGVLDVAIVGMTGRFPGASNVEQYWRNLRNGVESISVLTDAELLASGVSVETRKDPRYVRARGVVDDIELFDAEFFRYSPREAAIIDPQQRLFLECAWDALEQAGYDPDRYPGLIGVYAGSGWNTYFLNLLSRPEIRDNIHSLDVMIGSDKDFLSTRVSYKLNLRGPSLSIQTACSSSLVAVHMACQGLLTYQCDMALAGGVSIQMPQKQGYMYHEGSILSPDGHCRAFDAGAAGTVFSGGAGVVLLKRLADARADGDTVHAVIKGSAINNDGSLKAGYTAPSIDGQADAIARAQELAGISPETLSYIEAHGTGTIVGDPIEVTALTQVFRRKTDAKAFCAIGSVKTNIGHLDIAAGVAGLIKTALALKHRQLPASLNFEEANPAIDFANSPFYVNTKLSEWETNGHPRRAGVSSFGIGGTNAHVVMEEAAPEGTSGTSRSWQVLLLSARTDTALDAMTDNLGKHLRDHPDVNLADAAHTLQVGRKSFPHRRMVVCRDAEEAAKALETRAPQRVFSAVQERRDRTVAFMFTGQGSQYVGMTQGLYATEPTFRAQVDLCAELLKPHLGLDLREVLYPKDSSVAAQEEGTAKLLDQTWLTQPALFVIEYALAKLWMEWGVKPQAMIGHSIGEYVAACMAGVFSLEDALALVAARGRLMQELPDGAMLSVGLDEGQLRPLLGAELSLAAVNGPGLCVVAGPTIALETLQNRLQEQKVACQQLRTSHAFHSAMMEPILEAFMRLVQKIKSRAPVIPYISNVTGTWITTSEAMDANYWARHLRQTVRFGDGAREIMKDGDVVLLEVGPGQTLTTLARRNLEKSSERTTLPSLRPPQLQKPDGEFILETLGRLWLAGVPIDWSGFYLHERRRRVSLPTYPFQRQRYWLDPVAAAMQEIGIPPHPSLGRRLRLPLSKEIRFESRFSSHSPSYLPDHKLFEIVVVPGSSHMSTVLTAVEQVFGTASCVLEEVFFLHALALQDQDIRTVQLVIFPQEANAISFDLVSLPEGADENDPRLWTSHATGKIRIPSVNGTLGTTESVDLAALQDRCQQVFPTSKYYSDIWDAGYHMGDSFRWLNSVWRGKGEALCKMALPERTEDVGKYALHPGLIDSCVQVLHHCWQFDTAEMSESSYIYVPFNYASFRFYGRPQSHQLWCHGQVRDPDILDKQSVIGSFRLFEETGRLIAEITGLEVRKIEREQVVRSLQPASGEWLHEIAWRPAVLGSREKALSAEPGAWLILADRGGIGTALAALLRDQGQACITVYAASAPPVTQEDTLGIDPLSPQQFRDLLGKLQAAPRGIIYLWGLDVADAEKDDLPALEDAQAIGCGGVLHLVQAVAAARWPDAPRLWLVSRGTQAVSPDSGKVNLGNAALWGLGRVIAREYPNLRCTLLDLSSARNAREAQKLFDEIEYGGAENQVAYSDGSRHVARLVRQSVHGMAAQKEIVINAEGSYLITGGLGGLGLEIAKGLVEQGARQLALIGRSAPRENARAVIRKLEKDGALIMVDQTDVSDRQSLARLLDKVRQSMAPLRGIVHAAGVLDDGVLEQQKWQRFRNVMAPKIAGAWNLHVLTREIPLDFFVCFSSVASILGSSGQASYAAANAFMDALAHHRRGQGLPGLSINWGPWAEVGMAAGMDDLAKRRMSQQGWSSIAPEEGISLFGRLLARDEAQIGVLPVEWGTFLHQSSSGEVPAFLSELRRPVATGAKARPAAAEKTEILGRLRTAPESERRSILMARIEREVAAVLGLATSRERIDPQQGFFDMGMDSLLSVELRGRLQDSLGVSLSSTFAFNSNINQLTDLLLKSIEEDQPVVDTPSLVALQPSGSKPPFFFLAGRSHFGDRLGPDQPVYRVVYQDLDREQPLVRIEDMAAYSIKSVRTVQPDGPYYLGGHGPGGMVAFEMAQQLQRQGEKVALLALCECWTQDSRPPTPGTSSAYRLWQKVNYHFHRTGHVGAKQELANLLGSLRNKTQEAAWRRQGVPRTQTQQGHRAALYEAQKQYVPQAYAGRITVIRCSEHVPWKDYDPLYGWGKIATDGVEVYEIPGSHAGIYREPNVEMLVKSLNDVLRKAQATTKSEHSRLEDPDVTFLDSRSFNGLQSAATEVKNQSA